MNYTNYTKAHILTFLFWTWRNLLEMKMKTVYIEENSHKNILENRINKTVFCYKEKEI